MKSWIEELKKALDRYEPEKGPVRRVLVAKYAFLVCLPAQNWDPSGPLDFILFDDGKRVEVAVDMSLTEWQVIFEF